MKKFLLVGAFIVAAVVLVISLSSGNSEPEQAEAMPAGPDPANTTYLIEGQRVTLITGEAVEKPAPDSATSIITRIYTDPVVGDLDGDGNSDMALLLERETGGSGTFYYLVAALQNPDATAQGTNAIFIGDRVIPERIEIRNGVILLNYKDRKTDEPMSAAPSVSTSLYAAIRDGELTRVEPAG